MTHLTLSNVRDDVTAGFSTLTGFTVTSERNITTIKDNIEEIRTLGVQQNEKMQNLSASLRQRGLYKGSVCDFQSFHSCHSTFTGMGYHSRRHPHNRTSNSFIEEVPYR